VTERAFVLPPSGQLGPITPEQRKTLLANSLVAGVYEQVVDRESAYELIKGKTVANGGTAPAGGNAAGRGTGTATVGGGGAAPAEESGGFMDGMKDVLFGSTGPRGGQRDGLAQTMVKSAVRTIGTQVGREILRGVLGGLMGGSRRR
jgi:hypothetical protein